jgi:hypothetical protein
MPGKDAPGETGGDAEVEAPAGVWPSDDVRPALTAIATFDWLTGPSFPGLEIRIETFRFTG